MTALSLYTKTFRMVLDLSSREDTSWSPVYEHFSCLRESLVCCVCKKLMIIPFTKTTSHCSHNVCKYCIEGKIEPPCVWCTDDHKCEENVQLRIVLQCYKNMCKFIMSSGYFRNSLLSELSIPKFNFITMVSEGAKLDDEYRYTSTRRMFDKRLKWLSNFVPRNNRPPLNSGNTVYRLSLNHNMYPRVVLDKNEFKSHMQANGIDPERKPDRPEGITAYLVQKCLMTLKKRRNCRCGLATQHPGKLTCCGQRCPCYVSGKACFNCRCRGCRNPQRFRVASARIHKFRALKKIAAGFNRTENSVKTSDVPVTNGDQNHPSD